MKALTLHQPWASLIAVGAKTIETRSWPTKHRGRLLIHAGTARPPMMWLPPLMRARGPEADAHNRQTWHVIDTITAPEHQRPHITDRDHPMRDHVPKWATSPTLFWPHAGPHADVNEATGYARTMVLPLGAVVASAMLTDRVPIVNDGAARNCVDVRPGRPEAGMTLRMNEPVPVDSEGVPIPIRTSERGEVFTDVLDQLPFGDFSPGRWAWLLDDVKPTTERCPRCWGNGYTEREPWPSVGESPCPVCKTERSCEPVLMRGKQGLWNPEWEAAS